MLLGLVRFNDLQWLANETSKRWRLEPRTFVQEVWSPTLLVQFLGLLSTTNSLWSEGTDSIYYPNRTSRTVWMHTDDWINLLRTVESLLICFPSFYSSYFLVFKSQQCSLSPSTFVSLLELSSHRATSQSNACGNIELNHHSLISSYFSVNQLRHCREEGIAK